jgi:hypothetical protein
MAANVVKLKRSSVAGKIPQTTDLTLGEIALNTYDGRIYLKKSVSSVESIVTIQQVTGGTGVAVSVDGVVSIGQSVATTANVNFATGVFTDPSAGSNYTLKIGNATGSVFAIGTGSNSFGIANDALNNAQTGYVPYQVTATQVGFKTSANNYLWSFNADGTTQFPNYKFPAAAGTTGQVLSSNGDGTASWVTTSATSSGTVTAVSVVNTNGFTGTVATASSTPAITLKTTVNGLLKGNSTTGVVSAASAGSDYLAPNSISITTNSAGSENLTYSNGVFTFTPADLSSYVTSSSLSSTLSSYALTSAIPTNNNQLTNGAGYITSSALVGLATETFVTSRGYITGLSWDQLTNKPNLAGTYSWSIAADDSTQVEISSGNLVKIRGAGGITTASDADGNITITGSAPDRLTSNTRSAVLNSNGTFSLPTLTAAPVSPQAGQMALANGTSWDPMAQGNGAPYMVIYTGTGWIGLGGVTMDQVYAAVIELGI